MKRLIFTFLSAASLAISTATCAMWWKSNSSWEYVYAVKGRTGIAAVFEKGRVTLKFSKYRRPRSRTRMIGISLVNNLQAELEDAVSFTDGDNLIVEESDRRPYGRRLFDSQFAEGQFNGLHLASDPPAYRSRWIEMPCWALVAAMMLMPAAWLTVRLKNRNCRDAGHCSGCGYDLRATPERCPECGMTAPVRILAAE